MDDYVPMADHLAKLLCDQDYVAIPVYSAAEALAAAEKCPPQALIADIMMPGMNGVELACAFADKFPACRTLLMTANRWADEIFIAGLRFRVLQKPFEPAELFEFLVSCAEPSER